jgi:hypothetical protein
MGRTAPPKTYFDCLKQLIAKLCYVLVMMLVKFIMQGKGEPVIAKIKRNN